MPLWLYQIPNWLFGLLIVSAWTAAGVGGQALFQRFVRRPFDEKDKEVAITLLSVVATVNSLLLAFSAVSVWEAYGNAEKSVSSEANTLGELARDLAVYDTQKARTALEKLRAYTRAVVHEEWPLMQIGKESPDVRELLDELFRAVGDIRPKTTADATLMPEIWSRINELVTLRRVRVAACRGHMPDTLWAVVVIGTLLTLTPACVLPRTPFNRSMIGMLSMSMGLVFFFVAAMDRPFVGAESVGTDAFRLTLRSMARWEAQPRPFVERNLSDGLR